MFPEEMTKPDGWGGFNNAGPFAVEDLAVTLGVEVVHAIIQRQALSVDAYLAESPFSGFGGYSR